MRILVVFILALAVAGLVFGFMPPLEAGSGPTGKIYWGDGMTGKIRRSNLSGFAKEDLVSPVTVADIELDVSGGKMYWTAPVNGKVQRADLDGTSLEEDLVREIRVVAERDYYPIDEWQEAITFKDKACRAYQEKGVSYATKKYSKR